MKILFWNGKFYFGIFKKDHLNWEIWDSPPKSTKVYPNPKNRFTLNQKNHFKFQFQFQKSKIENRKSKIENRKPKTKNQKPKTKNQKPKTKNQKPKTVHQKSTSNLYSQDKVDSHGEPRPGGEVRIFAYLHKQANKQTSLNGKSRDAET